MSMCLRIALGSLIFIYMMGALLMYFSQEFRNTMIFLHVGKYSIGFILFFNSYR